MEGACDDRLTELVGDKIYLSREQYDVDRAISRWGSRILEGESPRLELARAGGRLPDPGLAVKFLA